MENEINYSDIWKWSVRWEVIWRCPFGKI